MTYYTVCLSNIFDNTSVDNDAIHRIVNCELTTRHDVETREARCSKE